MTGSISNNKVPVPGLDLSNLQKGSKSESAKLGNLSSRTVSTKPSSLSPIGKHITSRMELPKGNINRPILVRTPRSRNLASQAFIKDNSGSLSNSGVIAKTVKTSQRMEFPSKSKEFSAPNLNPKNNPTSTSQNVKKLLVKESNLAKGKRPSTPPPSPRAEAEEPPNLRKTPRSRPSISSQTFQKEINPQTITNQFKQLEELTGKLGKNEIVDVKYGKFVIVKNSSQSQVLLTENAMKEVLNNIQEAKSQGIPISSFPTQGPLGFLMKAVIFEAEDLNELQANLQRLNQEKNSAVGQDKQDIQRSITMIEDRIKLKNDFLNFIREKANDLSKYEQSEENLANLKGAGKIFDEISEQAPVAIKKFAETSDKINKSIDNPALKNNLSKIREGVILEANNDLQIYNGRKGRLFLNGLFDRYKSAAFSEKDNEKIKENLIKKPIASTDMAKGIGNSVKKLGDSLIPGYIESFHNDVLLADLVKGLNLNEKPKGATGSLDEEQISQNKEKFRENYKNLSESQINDLNETFSEMVSAYKGRGFGAGQQKYFEGYQKFTDLINASK